MESNKNAFLGTEPIGKLLFRLALPTVLAQLINMLYNIVDRMYIGRIPLYGEFALTGVGVCMPLIIIVSAFAALIGSGGGPRASIFMGKQDMATAERILGGCFTLQLVLSAVLTPALLLWSEDFLLLFGASAKTIGYARDYMQIYALGTVFVQLTLGMNAFITAQGFTKITMTSVLIGAISNIILDPICIFVLDMGVKGAALATVLSQALSCTWGVSFLWGKKCVLGLKLKNLNLSPKILLPCMALGFAFFVMQASESVISLSFNTSLLKYGGDRAVGAMTILTAVMQFAMLPPQGIAQGAQPLLSYNYGAKNADRVKKTFRLLLLVSIIYSVSLWALVVAFPRSFVWIFTNDKLLAVFAEKALRVYFMGMIFFGIQIACQMTFVSLGKSGCSVLVAVVRKFILLLPLIFIMPRLLEDPTMGVYSAEPIADILAVIFTSILFGIQFKKALKQIQSI